MSSAIVDQSAAILTHHFSKFIHALHAIAFPSGLPPVQGFLGDARRHANRRLPSSRGDVTGGPGVDLILCSQSSASTSSALDSDSQAVVPVAVPSPAIPAVRESARIRVKGPRNYTYCSRRLVD